MPIEKHFGSITFQMSVPLAPWDGDLESYTTEAHGEIAVISNDGEESRPAGTVKVKIVRLAEAIGDNVDLFSALDVWSLDEIHKPLFGDDGLYEPDMSFDGDLLVIEDIAVVSRLDDPVFRQQVIDTAIASFALAGIVLIPKKLLGLSVQNRSLKGYEALKGTSYLVRDDHKKRG